MFSFDGDHRIKRNVNLGERRAPPDRNALLQEARRAREQAQLAALREKAVLRLQRTVRGWFTRVHYRRMLRSNWEQAALAADSNLAETLSHLLKFFKRETDLPLLDLVLDRVLATSATTPDGAIFQTALQDQRLLLHFCRNLACLVPACSGSPAALVLIEAFHSEQAWVAPQLRQQFLELFQSAGTFAMLEAGVASDAPAPLAAAVSEIVTSIVQHGTDAVLRALAATLLTKAQPDALIRMIAGAAASPSLRSRVYGACVLVAREFCGLVEHVQSSWLLTNVATIFESAPELAQTEYVEFLSCTVNQASSIMFGLPPDVRKPANGLAVRSGRAGTMSDSDSETDEGTRLGEYLELNPAMRPLLRAGEILFSQCRHFFAAMLPASSGLTVSIDATLPIANVLVSLLQRTQHDPQQRSSLLSQIAFRQDFVLALWRYLAAQRSFLKDLSSSKLLSVEENFLRHISLFQLFADCYAYGLAVTDDTEFLDELSPATALQRPELVDLILHLKSVLLSLFKEAAAIRSSAELCHLRQSLVHLCTQLHARDCRTGFSKESHANIWLVPELSLATVKQTVNAEIFAAPDDPNVTAGVRQEDVHRLRLLKALPFFFRFEERAELFHVLLGNNQDMPFARNSVRVRRDHLYEDAFNALHRLGSQLRQGFRVSIVNELGLEEAGVDGGGLTREFLSDLLKKGFDPEAGFFKLNSENEIYPNPEAGHYNEDYIQHFEFLGQMLARVIQAGLLIELRFARFFLSKVLGKTPFLNELPSLDAELHRHLSSVKRFDGDVADLTLDFTIMDDYLGGRVVRELVPKGKALPVTNENRIRYIYAVANHRLNTQLKQHTLAFQRGMNDLIDFRLFKLFDEAEFQQLLSGQNIAVDVDDLERHTVYHGYIADDPTVIFFWRVVRQFTNEERMQLLKFATGCSRPPLFGFKNLRPSFGIAKAGDDQQRLPTASTCMNLLKLPPILDEDLMRSKLLYAIQAGAGFDLS
eukprot:m.859170 g.859170  ORF g.859170 m.859170 type:complete len:986 (-) comp59669_c0_seq11:179-3136(-)